MALWPQLLLLAVVLGNCKASSRLIEPEADLEGYSGLDKTEWALPSILYTNSSVTPELMAKYIRKVLTTTQQLGNFPTNYPDHLAMDIFAVADQVGIDPVVFGGLVAHESQFNARAVNIGGGMTGGHGLTQLTQIGVDEVNDQWEKKTIKKNIAYSPYVNTFIMETLKRTDFKRNLKKLGTPKDGISHQVSALFYGALLLKIYLTNVRSNPSELQRCTIPRDASLGNTLKRYYRAALACYNGHPINRLTYGEKVQKEVEGIQGTMKLTGDSGDPREEPLYEAQSLDPMVLVDGDRDGAVVEAVFEEADGIVATATEAEVSGAEEQL